MMKPYPTNKNSGIEWLGKIPEYWLCPKLKYCINLSSGESPPEGKDKFTGDYPIYGANGIIGYCNETNLNFKSIIIGRVGSSGEINISSNQCWVTDNALIVELIKKIHFDFIFYLLKSMNLNEMANKNAQPLITGRFIKNIIFPFPPLPEQQAIASFLDHKIKKIDELIEKTEKKIELLKEKRTSLINHCVTKGLNPNVEMKDSGVEWIGEIPSGWEVKRLKYFNDVFSSSVDRYIYEDELQVSVCHYPDVYNNEFINEDIELNKGSCSEVEFDRFHLKEGLVILTKDSESPDDIGIPCYVETNLKNVVCGYHLSIIEKNDDYINSKFLFRFIQSDIVRCHFEVHSKGITRFGLGKSIIENLFVNLPPLSEQQQIVEYLDEQTQKIDSTIEKETQRIVLLKEYRQSLISEVVTGKIDVRDEVVV